MELIKSMFVRRIKHLSTKMLCLLTGLFLFLPAQADDTDIYLESGANSANPPYLMLMVDYRPSTFSSFCNGLDNCVEDMTETSFASLCSQYAFQTAPAALSANTDEADEAREEICKKYFQDVDADGTADYDFEP